MIKNRLFSFMVLILFIFTAGTTHAQSGEAPPFWSDIRKFNKMDSALMPPKGKILLIGSSSFTRWQDVGYYLPGYPFINRGFGGSSLPHLIRYFDDIVKPYQPRQILIYCGENDLNPEIIADTIVDRFKTLFEMIRARDKHVFVTYISMKPSPSRIQYMDKMKEGNEKIQAWLKTKKRTSFVDVYHKMLLPDGKPMPDIFVKDELHLNSKGYEIWAREIAPHLLKN